jgi:hypothetical protein
MFLSTIPWFWILYISSSLTEVCYHWEHISVEFSLLYLESWNSFTVLSLTVQFWCWQIDIFCGHMTLSILEVKPPSTGNWQISYIKVFVIQNWDFPLVVYIINLSKFIHWQLTWHIFHHALCLDLDPVLVWRKFVVQLLVATAFS